MTWVQHRQTIATYAQLLTRIMKKERDCSAMCSELATSLCLGKAGSNGAMRGIKWCDKKACVDFHALSRTLFPAQDCIPQTAIEVHTNLLS